MDPTNTAVEVVVLRYLNVMLRSGNWMNELPVLIGTDPKISTPSWSQSNSSDNTVSRRSVLHTRSGH